MMTIHGFEEIIVLDPNLRSIGSHHFQYDISIFKAAQELGVNMRFFCHQCAGAEVFAALPATPAFADPAGWLRKILRLPLCRQLPPQLTGLALHLADGRQKRLELERCFRSLSLQNRLVLVPESSAALNIALLRALRRKWTEQLKVVFVFHYPASRHLMRASLRALAPWVEANRVFLVATNEPLAESYRTSFKLPFGVLPWPLEFPPLLDQAVKDELRPVNFLAVGGFRMEKGVDLLSASLRALSSEIDARRLRFVIQGFPNPQSPDPEADRYFERLRAFAADHPGVWIIDRALDPQGLEYRQIYEEADVVLLPYRQKTYAMRISAVLMESLALGKPVISTAGSCMAKQTGPNAGLTFADGDAAALTLAIRRIAAELPRFTAAAKDARQAWVAFHNPRNYLRVLGDLAAHVPDHSAAIRR